MSSTAALLTYAEASRRLAIKVSTLYSLVHQRRIPHVRLGRRMVRFDPLELDRWVDAQRCGVGNGRP